MSTGHVCGMSTSIAWPSDAASYSRGEQIGGGKNRSVWAASCTAHEPPASVALKIVDLDKQSSQTILRLQEEVQRLGQLSHANIVTLHTAFVSRGELWLVMQMHAAGSCADVMRFWGHPFEEPAIFGVLREVSPARGPR